MPVETAIYEPPRSDLPYLVVTLVQSGIDVVPVATRTEARTMVAQRTRRKPRPASNGRSRPDPA